MDELSTFLTVRLAEIDTAVEKIAKNRLDQSYSREEMSVLSRADVLVVRPQTRYSLPDMDAWHWLLADTAAKRRVLARHALRVVTCEYCSRAWPCADVRDVASAFVAHPDYQDAWRP